jgi:hypothetical protein
MTPRTLGSILPTSLSLGMQATLIESSIKSKTICIFSDMMNETKAFPIPEILQLGSDKMLDEAKTNGWLVR